MKVAIAFLLLAVSTIAYTPGDYSFTLTHDGQQREFQVHVPQNVQDPAPVVFAFHPWLSTASNMRQISSFDDKADMEKFVVVFPQGIGNSWNAGGCCGTAQQQNVDDIGFVSKMLDEIEQNHNIDTDKVYATGFSNGGMISHRIGADLSDRFAAVAAVAGARVTFENGPSRAMPVLHINSVDDTLSTMSLTYVVIDWWKTANSCSDATRQELDQGAYCDIYPCGDVELRLCVTQDGGHSWPGGWSLRYTPSTAFSATDMIWEFFVQNSLDANCVTLQDLISAIDNYLNGSSSIETLLTRISEWKSGC